MSYQGQKVVIPAGAGGLNAAVNQERIPILDLIDANGIIFQGGALQKEPGAVLFDENGITSSVSPSASPSVSPSASVSVSPSASVSPSSSVSPSPG